MVLRRSVSEKIGTDVTGATEKAIGRTDCTSNSSAANVPVCHNRVRGGCESLRHGPTSGEYRAHKCPLLRHALGAVFNAALSYRRVWLDRILDLNGKLGRDWGLGTRGWGKDTSEVMRFGTECRLLQLQWKSPRRVRVNLFAHGGERWGFLSVYFDLTA
jgi:hypothetical protein